MPQEIERGAVLSSMRRLFDSALGRDLRQCPTCRRPFVAPREVLGSDDGTVADVRMLDEHVLDLSRRDVLAATDDRVVRPAASAPPSVTHLTFL